MAIIGVIVVPRIMNPANSNTSTDDGIIRVTVEGEEVKKGTLTTYIDLTGNISAESSINIIPTVPSEVEKIYVKVGDSVKKGDLLFALDPSNLKNQVEQSEIGLNTAAAGVKQAKVGVTNANIAVEQATIAYDMAKSSYEMNLDNYEFSVANLEKYEQLFNEGIVSEAEFEQMKLQASPETLTVLEKQLEQAKQALEQAKIGVQNATLGVTQAEAGEAQAKQGYDLAIEALEDMTFVAPIDGYITTINLVENQFASNAQPAIVIEAMDSVTVKTNVTENVINKLKIGQEVTVEIRTIKEEVFTGIIDTLSPSADMRSLLYPMTISIPNPNNVIKPGMFATITAKKDEAANALYVPSGALTIRDASYYVYVAGEDNHAKLREVEIGLDTGSMVEIIMGLSEGEVVVTTGMGFIDEDTTITVIRGEE